MSANKKGPNAVGHNNVFSAVTTALVDMLSNKGQLPPIGEDERIDGKTCLVTGSNSGLGKAVAVDLAKRGGHVIMACRSGVPEAGEEVKRLSGSDKVEMIQVDLSDMASVSKLCDTLKAREIKLDITVMNAGLMPLNSRRSAQGFELMFAVHFLANRLMLSRMVADGVIAKQADKEHPRVIFVSSEAHQSSDPIDFENFGAYTEYGLKDGLKYYGKSKLHLNTLASELSRQLNPDYVEADANANAECNAGAKNSGQVDIAVSALCPGPVASNIAKESPGFLRPIIGPIMKFLFNSPEKAAQPIILLACGKAMANRTGVYMHMMREKPCSDLASDRDNGIKMWQKSQLLLADFLPSAKA